MAAEVQTYKSREKQNINIKCEVVRVSYLRCFPILLTFYIFL